MIGKLELPRELTRGSLQLISDTVKMLVATSLHMDLSDIRDDSSLYSLTNWDSLGHVNIMVRIEKWLGYTIPSYMAQRLTSIERISHYVQSLTHGDEHQ